MKTLSLALVAESFCDANYSTCGSAIMRLEDCGGVAVGKAFYPLVEALVLHDARRCWIEVQVFESCWCGAVVGSPSTNVSDRTFTQLI